MPQGMLVASRVIRRRAVPDGLDPWDSKGSRPSCRPASSGGLAPPRGAVAVWGLRARSRRSGGSRRPRGSTAATTGRHSRLKLTVRDSVRDGRQSSRESAARREEPPGRSKYPPTCARDRLAARCWAVELFPAEQMPSHAIAQLNDRRRPRCLSSTTWPVCEDTFDTASVCRQRVLRFRRGRAVLASGLIHPEPRPVPGGDAQAVCARRA